MPEMPLTASFQQAAAARPGTEDLRSQSSSGDSGLDKTSTFYRTEFVVDKSWARPLANVVVSPSFVL